MIYFIFLVINILIIFTIDNYFSIKRLEELRNFDYERDKEIFEGVGISKFNGIDFEITKKIKKHKQWLIILLLVNIILLITYFKLFNVYSYKQLLFGLVFIGIQSFLVFLDNWFNVQEFSKLKNIDYRNFLLERRKRLATPRQMYIITSIIFAIFIAVILNIGDLKTIDPDYYNLVLSFLFIYLGGMGLKVKMMFLKVPLRLDGKFQPYFNTLLLGFGLYLLIRSWINILLR